MIQSFTVLSGIKPIKKYYRETCGNYATGVMNGYLLFAPKCKAVQYDYIRFNFQYELRDNSNNSIFLHNVEEERDLGIQFESSLKFNKHVLDVVNKT